MANNVQIRFILLTQLGKNRAGRTNKPREIIKFPLLFEHFRACEDFNFLEKKRKTIQAAYSACSAFSRKGQPGSSSQGNMAMEKLTRNYPGQRPIRGLPFEIRVAPSIFLLFFTLDREKKGVSKKFYEKITLKNNERDIVTLPGVFILTGPLESA